MNKASLIFLALIIALVGVCIYLIYPSLVTEEPSIEAVATDPVFLSRMIYMCNEGKNIDVAFYDHALATATPSGEMPVPTGNAKMVLSDGRTFDLMQTISGSGVRYANQDESFVFWNKGNGALVLEDNAEKNYRGCVRVADDMSNDLPAMYSAQSGAFSLRLPEIGGAVTDGYRIDDSFVNTLSPDLSITGVRFTIPESWATSTNLSSDSYISIEQIPQQQECSGDMFFDGEHTATAYTEGEVLYSRSTVSDAGAGNRYEQIIYALPGTNPCTAVRYMIHSTAIENYGTSSDITAFNRDSLIAEFDAIRKTLVINQ